MENKLYEFTMRVLPGNGCSLPEEMVGAYVPCYASGTDYQAALRKGVSIITEMNYVFDDIKNGVREISISSWDSYIEKVWPEFVDSFPTKEQLSDLVAEDGVFFGPFIGFKNQETCPHD